MGNVHMEARQVNYRGGNKPMSVEEAIKEAGGGYVLPAASAETLGGVKVGDNLTVEEDGTLNAPDPYTPPEYDTDETETGETWVDGKPIYRRVVDIGALPDSSTKTITLGLTIDTLISLHGGVKAANAGFLPLPYTTYDGSTPYATWVSIDESGDLVVTDNGPFGTAGYTGVCIIEYTKVTV